MSNGNRIGPEYGPDYGYEGGNGQQPAPQTAFEGLSGLDVHGRTGEMQQPDDHRQQPPHPQPTEGWGVGEYDADATAFVQLPTGGVPGADPFGPGAPGGYGDPLAAPGTGQGMYTPPSIDPSVRDGAGYAGAPVTPPSLDPASTGQWSLPFAPQEPQYTGTDAATSEHQQHYDGQYGYPADSASAMGQGAAAALAGSHEARTRRPLGTGGGRLPEEEFTESTAAHEQYAQQLPEHQGYEPAQTGREYPYEYAYQQEYSAGAHAPASEAQFAEAHARRQVPFEGFAEMGPNLAQVPEPQPYPTHQYGDTSGGEQFGTAGEEGYGEFPPVSRPEAGASGPERDAGQESTGEGRYGDSSGGSVHSGIPWAPSTPSVSQPEPQYRQDVHGQWPAEPGDPVPGAEWGDAAPDEQQPAQPEAGHEPWTEPGLPPHREEFPPEQAAEPAQPAEPGNAESGPETEPGVPEEAQPAPSALPEESAPDPGSAPDGALPEAVEQPDADAAEPDGSAAPAGDGDGQVAPEEGADAYGAPEAAEVAHAVQAAEAPEAPWAGPESAPEEGPALDTEHPHTSYVLHVNGVDRTVSEAWIGESLLYVLRERLGLAGAKDGCSQGECGACSVQVDGRLVASCLVPSATAAGSDIRTVEGLAADGRPSDVQRALTDSGAVQCGFCVPGMAMAVHDLLEGNHKPTELQTRQAICGNLCRCSGYRGVLDAVRTVVGEREARAGREIPETGGRQAVPEGEPQPAGPAEQPEAVAYDQASFLPETPDGVRIPHQAGPGAGGVHPPEDGGA